MFLWTVAVLLERAPRAHIEWTVPVDPTGMHRKTLDLRKVLFNG